MTLPPRKPRLYNLALCFLLPWCSWGHRVIAVIFISLRFCPSWTQNILRFGETMHLSTDCLWLDCLPAMWLSLLQARDGPATFSLFLFALLPTDNHTFWVSIISIREKWVFRRHDIKVTKILLFGHGWNKNRSGYHLFIYLFFTFFFFFLFLFFFFFVVDFVINWNETAMGLHVFSIPIPPSTSLSTQSL